MNNYENLISELENNFSSFERPTVIYVENPTQQKLRIQDECGHAIMENLIYEKCVILIFEGPLMSDEAYLYFLPRLARAVLCEDADEFLMYRRLERINKRVLAESQQRTLERLIDALKKKEADLEEEERRELEEAWKDWEKKRLEKNTLPDKFLWLVARNQLEEVKKLVEQDVTLLNVKDPLGDIPLSIAKMREHDDMVQLLIELASVGWVN
jgi:ankyrin repeat protein